MSRPANPEDEDEEACWEKLPYKEDGTKDQVSFVTQFVTQVRLKTHTRFVMWSDQSNIPVPKQTY